MNEHSNDEPVSMKTLAKRIQLLDTILQAAIQRRVVMENGHSTVEATPSEILAIANAQRQINEMAYRHLEMKSKINKGWDINI